MRNLKYVFSEAAAYYAFHVNLDLKAILNKIEMLCSCIL